MTDVFTVTKVSAANPILRAHALAIHRLVASETESLCEYILEIGRHLFEAHQHTEHKVWVVWIADEFGWDLTTALRFTRAYVFAQKQPIYARNSRGELSQRPEPSSEGGSSAA